MITCSDCRYNDFPYVTDERSIPPCMKCHDWEFHKRKTNADRIRAMTDEELAHLLNECVCPIDQCPHYYEDRSCTKAECEKCWLDWLRREVTDV